jgi:hypothetical protein
MPRGALDRARTSHSAEPAAAHGCVNSPHARAAEFPHEQGRWCAAPDSRRETRLPKRLGPKMAAMRARGGSRGRCIRNRPRAPWCGTRGACPARAITPWVAAAGTACPRGNARRRIETSGAARASAEWRRTASVARGGGNRSITASCPGVPAARSRRRAPSNAHVSGALVNPSTCTTSLRQRVGERRGSGAPSTVLSGVGRSRATTSRVSVGTGGWPGARCSRTTAARHQRQWGQLSDS